MTLAVVALIALAAARASQPANLPGQPCTAAALVGSWTLVEGKVGDRTTPTGPSDPVAYKHITPTHFVVYQVAAGTNAITYALGGAYTLAGGTYTESVQHGFGATFQSVGVQSVPFQCSIEGNNRWHISGKIGGTPIREIWERLSANPKAKLAVK